MCVFFLKESSRKFQFIIGGEKFSEYGQIIPKICLKSIQLFGHCTDNRRKTDRNLQNHWFGILKWIFLWNTKHQFFKQTLYTAYKCLSNTVASRINNCKKKEKRRNIINLVVGILVALLFNLEQKLYLNNTYMGINKNNAVNLVS